MVTLLGNTMEDMLMDIITEGATTRSVLTKPAAKLLSVLPL
ncbi:hypothetical protein [Candidatus Ichthyocystis sparus]|nr:hypothetical protein [Candidatus Ichthyocystis sparus]